MREVVLTVPRIALEDVLDRLLLIVPGGVHEGRAGAHVELRISGGDVPAADEIARAVGRWPHTLTEREAPDDWRQRRLEEYEPDVIGGRLVVRPEWAPPAPRGFIDIALGESAAFGGGTHVTTRTCLEWLLEIQPRGSFADLGCGTGVLGILAARLGWKPIVVLDVQPESVDAAADNAACNGVVVQAALADLAAEPPPRVDGFAANVPALMHELIGDAMAEPSPCVALVSGFGPEDAAAVFAAYGRRGLGVRRQDERLGWTVAVLERD